MSFTNLYATHIVGGDFYYKYLGGDKYQITLKLYIDCYNGNVEAIKSDETAIISVFGANNNAPIEYLEITRTGPVHLFGVAYKCVNNPGDVCVDQYTYIFETNLPKRKDGYIISFERCCRNNTIKNIYQPDGTGATYWVHVPDRDLVASDNSPIFKKFPPIFICKGFPLVFDHSATDVDGDSLTYELYHPYLGADKSNPSPGKPGNTGTTIPPNPPPFKNIYWASGYNTANQMRGTQILEIDELTGELTVTPDDVGQFVCGVKVKEWRKINGVWIQIGETLRDYQFNVIECDAVAVANFKPTIWCSDTVKFTDRSIGANRVSWEFGDIASGFNNNSSQQRNPIHLFSKGGDYTVKQTAWNTACNDEYSLKVKVRIKKGFDIGKDKMYCVPFKTTASVPWTDYNSIVWSTGSKASFITIDKPGTYMVEAKYGDCILRDTINIGYDPVSFTPLRDSLFCDKVLVDLVIKNRSPKTNILWISLKDTSAKVTVDKEGKYSVQVFNNNCLLSDTVELVLAKITPNLGPDLFICNNFSQTLDAGVQPTGTSYLWHDGSTNQQFYTDTAGRFFVTTQLKHCIKTDEIIIKNSKVILNIGPDKHFCDSVRILVDAGPPNEGAITTYAWGDGLTTQTNFIKTEGKHWVTKTDTYGCNNSDTIQFFMTHSPIIDIGKDTTICLRSPIKLTPGGYFNTYVWENGLTDKIRFVEEAGKYFVTVTDEVGCQATDTIVVKTDPNKLPNTIYIPNAFTPNGDGLNDVFPFEMPVVYNDYNLKVFTRWGEKIYDSDSTPNPWDGVTLKEADQLDAYIWVATYKACDGKRHTDKGTITILR
ncbi:MAG: gliding motility-associated C-terminal domain-containing protein [Bacteroidia bacterium]